MKFEYTHYKVTKEQTLEKIEAYLKSIGASPEVESDEYRFKNIGYIILYQDGEYGFYYSDGDAPESFIPKTPKK